MLKLARPWLTERRLVVKPNMAASGASAWMTSMAAFESAPWIRPPRWVTRLIDSPRKSLGVMMSTFMTGSSMTGSALRAASSYPMAPQASKASGVESSSSYSMPTRVTPTSTAG